MESSPDGTKLNVSRHHFLPNVSLTMQYVQRRLLKRLKSLKIGSKSGGGTKHSLSPRGSKVWGASFGEDLINIGF